MSCSVAMRADSTREEPAPFSEFRRGTYGWRVLECYRKPIENATLDWLNPADAERGDRIKSNSQRDVWRVSLNDHGVFVKIYHPNGVAARLKLLLRGPTALEEWQVGRYAEVHSIAAVRPVACAWAGRRGADGPSVLITEAIPGAVPLNTYWLTIRDDPHTANALVEALARLIARAHQCGFRHGDLHPGNILVGPQRHLCDLFFVDLHKVGIGRSVALRGVITNLAQLNQWFRRNATRSQRLRFLTHYLADRDRFAQASPYARNWRINPRTLAANLARQAERHANRLWAKRDRRANRTSRYFARIKPAPGWRGLVMLRSKHPAPAAAASRLEYRAADWKRWLSDPLQWTNSDRHELLKDSHSATICKARLQTEPHPAVVIVKRSRPRNAWKRLLQMCSPSRARRAWQTANRLINRDLPTAQPLALLERFTLGLVRTDSLSITEYMVDSADLETFLTRDVAALPRHHQRRVKDRLIAAAVRLLKDFHGRGFAHRDLKAPNLLVNWRPPFDDLPCLTLIDMDGIRHVGRPDQRQRTRALVRLCVSLLPSPACTRTDRLRALQSYLTGPGRTPKDWKCRWREIDALALAKLNDKVRRRRWKIKHYGRE
ncbi:MAG: lipopolysaccharide kinase InaA family protein [Phycisphaerae bacterium]